MLRRSIRVMSNRLAGNDTPQAFGRQRTSLPQLGHSSVAGNLMKSAPLVVACTLAVIVSLPVSLVGGEQKRPSAPASPQQAAGARVDEATALTNGWALLAQGLPADASRKAAETIGRFPRSAAALALWVEAEMARGGFAAASEAYERWLNRRPLEEPAIVRRLAKGLLTEAATQRSDAMLRIEALKALAEGGEAGATDVLASTSSPADVRALASLGDEKAAKQLAAQLSHEQPDKLRTIEALGQSGRRSVIPVVAAQLTDPREEVRAASADALAGLRATGEVASLRRLLSDPSSYVRTRAARALFRLGDMTGLPLLQNLTASDTAMSRLIAAEAMSSDPDQNWLALVRSLASSSEPEVRAGAARLLAAHDPDLARQALTELSRDPNIAIRELATRTLAESLPVGDLATLRQLMKNGDPLTRVRAAGAVLKATR